MKINFQFVTVLGSVVVKLTMSTSLLPIVIRIPLRSLIIFKAGNAIPRQIRTALLLLVRDANWNAKRDLLHFLIEKGIFTFAEISISYISLAGVPMT